MLLQENYWKNQNKSIQFLRRNKNMGKVIKKIDGICLGCGSSQMGVETGEKS
jgi:Fe-S cluster biogenesis protein NfuA